MPAAPRKDGDPSDTLTHLRRGLRLNARLDYVGGMGGPWVLDHNSGTAIWIHLVTRGRSFVHSPSWPKPLQLDAGDLILFMPHAPKHYLACSADAPVIGAPGAARVPHDEGSAGLVCALIELATHGSPLWRALPGEILIRYRDDDDLPQLIRVIIAEARSPGFASRSLIERLLDACFVLILRHCIERGLLQAGALAAFHERRIATALGLMHGDPSRAWTVHELAARAGLSRTALNDRFATVIGRTPMEYLAVLRMQLAATWLAAPGATIEGVAARCGYDSASAFSRMFKRHHGVSPGAYRRRPGAAAVPG